MPLLSGVSRPNWNLESWFLWREEFAGVLRPLEIYPQQVTGYKVKVYFPHDYKVLFGQRFDL